jgi:hypothetical protein
MLFTGTPYVVYLAKGSAIYVLLTPQYHRAGFVKLEGAHVKFVSRKYIKPSSSSFLFSFSTPRKNTLKSVLLKNSVDVSHEGPRCLVKKVTWRR